MTKEYALKKNGVPNRDLHVTMNTAIALLYIFAKCSAPGTICLVYYRSMLPNMIAAQGLGKIAPFALLLILVLAIVLNNEFTTDAKKKKDANIWLGIVTGVAALGLMWSKGMLSMNARFPNMRMPFQRPMTGPMNMGPMQQQPMYGQPPMQQSPMWGPPMQQQRPPMQQSMMPSWNGMQQGMQSFANRMNPNSFLQNMKYPLFR